MSLLALVNSGCPRVSHEHRKKLVDEPEQRKCFLCEPTIKFTFNPLGLCDKIKEIIIPNSKTEFRFMFHMIFSNEDSIYYLPLELELIIFNFIQDYHIIDYIYTKKYTIDNVFMNHTKSCLSCSRSLLFIMDNHTCNKHIVPRHCIADQY